MGKYPEIQAQEQVGILHINFLPGQQDRYPCRFAVYLGG